jgi:hypothetical protein
MKIQKLVLYNLRKGIFLFFILIVSCSPKLSESSQGDSVEGMKVNFKIPPQNTKPWVYWYWLNNHISKEGITKDLEAMANIGIGAAFIGNIYLDDVPEGKVPVLSQEWKELTQHAIREGGRLGVDIGLFNSPGWSQSGGPWNKESNSMRYLTSSKIQIIGGQKIKIKLPKPTADFDDVSVLVFPASKGQTFDKDTFKITSDTELVNLNNLIDGEAATTVDLPEGVKEVSLLFESDKDQVLRSLALYPSKSAFSMNVKLLADINGSWREIRSFKFDRSNAMDQLGFDDYPPVVVSFPEVSTKKLKLELSNINPNSPEIGLADIALSSIRQLEYYIEKKLAKMHQTPLPLGDAYKWPHQQEPKEKALVLSSNEVIDISDRLADDGILTWQVPEGKWTILRFGMTTTGIKNAPAAPEAVGLEVDKINKNALKKHFESFIGEILKSMPVDERKAFKYVVADSYEAGSQNWTDDFGQTFKESYKYDPKPYLPVLTGTIVNSVEESNRFLWDLRRLIADKVAYEYVGGLRELCEENGLKMWLENYGHWGFPSEFLMYGGQSNLIGGEFWAEGDLGSIECRAASSAAHIYGKKQVSAESYTAAGNPFLRYPGLLKKRGDWSFTEGINHPVLHVYIEQPYDSVPGVNAWFGTEFNRNNTWFNKAKPWIDYQRRCQFMLQKGEYVADIAYFIGEDTPKMTGVMNPELPEGYSFDYINAEVIMNRISVKDGRITLPEGLSYKILVLPDIDTMRPDLLDKIKTLVAQGAVIMGNPPKKSPSLQNYETADNKIEKFAKELWGDAYNGNETVVNYGKGKVFLPTDLDKALKEVDVEPDFKTDSKQPVLWIHRKMKDKDIYFLTNQSDAVISFNASFRVKGMQPELWDAVTGSTRALPQYSETKSYTSVPLKFEPAESGFIVFLRNPSNTYGSGQFQNFEEPHILKSINSQWNVLFKNDKIGINKTIPMDTLKDWTQINDNELKYFSGTATYTTDFNLDTIPSNIKVFLNVGKANILANIKINGIDAGGIWTAPWQIDVTDYLRKGKNLLEIEVTNLWVNQLIGDSRNSIENKKTWTLLNTYDSNGDLSPSGLVGPVKLIHYNELH